MFKSSLVLFLFCQVACAFDVVAPISGRVVDFSLARKISQMPQSVAVRTLREKGIRVIKVSSLGEILEGIDEGEEFSFLERPIREAVVTFDALGAFFPKNAVVGAPAEKISADTIMVREDATSSAISHEYLHFQFNAMPAGKIGTFQLKSREENYQSLEEMRKPLEDIRAKRSRMEPSELTLDFLQKYFELEAQTNYLTMLENLATVLEELDIHLLMYEQKLKKQEDHLDILIPSKHLKRFETTLRDIVSYNEKVLSPEEHSKNMRHWYQATSDLKRPYEILKENYLQMFKKLAPAEDFEELFAQVSRVLN